MPSRDLQDILATLPRDPRPWGDNRYYECAVCGQTVDREHIGQVFHHNEEPHDPLPPQ